MSARCKLAEQQGDVHQLFTAVYGLWQSNIGSGAVEGAHRLSDRLLQLTADDADDGLRLQAHHSAWTTYLFAGEPAAAREHCEAGRRLYDPDAARPPLPALWRARPGRLRPLYGCVRLYWLLGYPQKGLVIGSESLALAEQIGHPFSRATPWL